MTLERVEKKIDRMSEILTESILEQAKTNVRHDMSIEENSQQTLNLATRLGEAEKVQKTNGPTIAFAAKLQANMSKIAVGVITVIAGSWAIGNSNPTSEHAETTVKNSKK